MQLKCPHKKNIKKNVLLGIIAYYHEEDNTSCILLNKLDVVTDVILDECVNTIVIDKETKVAFILSETAREKIYKALESKTGEVFAKYFLDILDVIVNLPISLNSKYFEELVERYGDVGVHNIKMLSGVECSQYRRKNKNKYMRMYKLRASDCRAVIQLKELSQTAAAGMQRLSNIVDNI